LQEIGSPKIGQTLFSKKEKKMNIGINLPKIGIGLFIVFFGFSFFFISCQEDPIEVPQDDVFTKAKQEHLGNLLMNDILSSNEFLPQLPPYDTSIYWYVQTLYSQASSIMQLDKQSPSDNRWTQDWKVFIIDDDATRHAFTLPGGDLFITTGLLKSFEKEYELYYFLTFEAVLMNNGHLLDQLKADYNSLTLLNLIEGRPTASGITVQDLATDFPDLVYSSNVVKTADQETVNSICNTSILESTGATPSLIDPAFQDAEWLLTRESYTDRPATIQGFANDNVGDCGHNLGSGNYQRFVLDVLK